MVAYNFSEYCLEIASFSVAKMLSPVSLAKLSCETRAALLCRLPPEQALKQLQEQCRMMPTELKNDALRKAGA